MAPPEIYTASWWPPGHEARIILGSRLSVSGAHDGLIDIRVVCRVDKPSLAISNDNPGDDCLTGLLTNFTVEYRVACHTPIYVDEAYIGCERSDRHATRTSCTVPELGSVTFRVVLLENVSSTEPSSHDVDDINAGRHQRREQGHCRVCSMLSPIGAGFL